MLCATGLLQAAADQSQFRFLCYYPLVFPIPNFLFLHICEHPIYKRNTFVFPSTKGRKSVAQIYLYSTIFRLSTKKSSVFPLYVLTFMCKHATPPRFFWVSLTGLTKFNIIFKFTYLLYWNFNSIFFAIKPCISCRTLHFPITALMCVINLHVFFKILSSLLK